MLLCEIAGPLMCDLPAVCNTCTLRAPVEKFELPFEACITLLRAGPSTMQRQTW